MQQTSQEQDQTEFIEWLAQQLKVTTHEQLQTKLKGLGSDGIKKAYMKFQEEKQKTSYTAGESEDPVEMKRGGKLDYIKCLQAYKRGGAMEAKKCGCGAKFKSKMQGGGEVATDTASKDNTQSMEKGGFMKGKKIGKKQSGGSVNLQQFAMDPTKPLSPTNVLMTEHSDGTYKQWGKDVKANPDPRNYILNKTQNGINSISFAEMDHLQKTVPFLEHYIGKGNAKEGYVTTFGPDQSDVIRKLIAKFPMQKQALAQPPAPASSIASNKKGGKVADKEESGKPKGSTGVSPKWAKKAVKGSSKPKSNDVEQEHYKGKKQIKQD